MLKTEPLSYRLLTPDAYPAGAGSAPLVLDSPHSGTSYPPDFAPAADFAALRTAEDTWVDDLWSGALELGVPMISATFPRTYIDPNRGEDDIDPLLLAGEWPGLPGSSSKVRLGKGLIWRMLDDGTPLYARKLSVAEVRHRIDACWKPYHRALRQLLDAAHQRFGKVWHINCHSMPSVAAAYATEKPGLVHPDFVLGDRDGTTAAPEFRRFVAEWLREKGYEVAENDPYKGVELVRVFGRPGQGRHSLQIEVNRKLYMDETTLRPGPGYARLQNDLRDLVAALVAWAGPQLQ
jgi:N-formylglutamate amidohydrolase